MRGAPAARVGQELFRAGLLEFYSRPGIQARFPNGF
jgi:hypothetical protein